MGFLDKLRGDKDGAEKCSVCGYKFSPEPTRGSDLMALVIAKKGFACSKCGRLYCMKCAPKDSTGTLVCHCGGNLGFRD